MLLWYRESWGSLLTQYFYCQACKLHTGTYYVRMCCSLDMVNVCIIGVRICVEKAFLWESAAGGYPGAYFRLGLLYEQGVMSIVEPNIPENGTPEISLFPNFFCGPCSFYVFFPEVTWSKNAFQKTISANKKSVPHLPKFTLNISLNPKFKKELTRKG